jgi:hypothetical protein
MVPVKVKAYTDAGGTEGEVRIGWASWDEGYQVESIKWAYHDKRGHIARSSPEVPFDVLVEMIIFALDEGRLSAQDIEKIREKITKGE